MEKKQKSLRATIRDMGPQAWARYLEDLERWQESEHRYKAMMVEPIPPRGGQALLDRVWFGSNNS